MTFADLHNIKGYDGDPITYYVDDSWRLPPEPKAVKKKGPSDAEPRAANASFLKYFTMASLPHGEPLAIPPVTRDHVFPGPGEPPQFMTSDQCLPCHSGQAGKNRTNMFRHAKGDKPEFDFSPHGEWRWSPMGLAGRDPIFYAQLESQLAQHPQHAAMIQNTCFSCHGVMGQHQLKLDQPDRMFDQALVYQVDPSNPDSKYGALARDGVSCAACHHIAEDKRPVKELFTGNFPTGPADKIYGPYNDVQTRSMKDTTGVTPVEGKHMKSSRVCGACHTVLLPVFDKEGKQVGEFLEQATYPEWLNSAYQNEYGQGSDVQTCQDCHMPRTLDGEPTAGRIANVQDDQYPEAPARAPIEELTVKYREGFSRHRLLGLNALLLTMFEQNDHLLGVRKKDFMTNSKEGLSNALRGIDQIAKTQTADISIETLSLKSGVLESSVKLVNKVGHRFPSGVGFRRAFLEFAVLDKAGDVLWASGRTNDVGFIIGPDGKSLPSELHENKAYQPHYEVVESEDQVQIYEELVKDPYGEFTTGFLDIKSVVKDNRLLPKGWTREGPKGFPWAKETAPHGKADHDKDFTDGQGGDLTRYRIALSPKLQKSAHRVVATLYYQSAPPGFLTDRFKGADGPATRRLFDITSHLKVKGTRLDGWKLKIVSASREVSPAAP
jgi:mono/diheme cytochrome c family protein